MSWKYRKVGLVGSIKNRHKFHNHIFVCWHNFSRNLSCSNINIIFIIIISLYINFYTKLLKRFDKICPIVCELTWKIKLKFITTKEVAWYWKSLTKSGQHDYN